MQGQEKKTTVTVIGAGAGGFGLITHLGCAGYGMRLHDLDDTKLAAIRAHGGVDVENGPRAFAPVDMATTDLAQAVAGAQVIIFVTGGTTHATLARTIAPFLEDGQLILLIQGNTGGALIVRQALAQGGCRAHVDLAEMDTYPYATARPAPTRARLVTSKRWLQIAAFPGHCGKSVFTRLSPLFPEAVLAPNILVTGLTNMNAVLHVANCVANAGRIESGGDFRFYAEGVTPAVVNLYQGLDAERLAMAARFGVTIPSLPEWLERVYGVREPSLPATFQRLTFDALGPYQNTPTPTALAHKYVAEDVPTGVLPMSALGRAAGVVTPILDGLVHLACSMAGQDFAAEARTLDRLGLANKNVTRILDILEHGFA
jgi:opine dehydrogenase